MDTPEAQSFVIDYLKRCFPGMSVSSSPLADVSTPYITLRREGGGALDSHRDGPGIGVYCWEETEAKAALLAKRVSKAMQKIVFEHGVAKVVEEALYSAPDPKSHTPRWYGSYTLTTYQI